MVVDKRKCLGSAEMGQTALLFKLVTGNKNPSSQSCPRNFLTLSITYRGTSTGQLMAWAILSAAARLRLPLPFLEAAQVPLVQTSMTSQVGETEVAA